MSVYAAIFRIAALLCCLLAAGCGSWRISDLWDKTPLPAQQETPEHLPAMPEAQPMNTLQAPQLPAGLLQAPASTPPATPDDLSSLPAPHGTANDTRTSAPHSAQQAAAPLPDNTQNPPATPASAAAQGSPPNIAAGPTQPVRIAYTVAFRCEERPDMAEKLQELSLLEKLRSTPPDDFMGLEYRIRSDEELAAKIMRSEGYYDGTTERQIATEAAPVQVTLVLHPDRQYVLGSSEVRYTRAVPDKAPRTLNEAGMQAGAPARAETVLDAIESLPPRLRRQGYPLAQTDSSSFAINPEVGVLHALAVLDEGPLARMNKVRVQGSDSVSLRYFQRMRNWRKGQLWNENLTDAYQEILTQQGVFRSVSITPVPADTQELDDDGLFADALGEVHDKQANDPARPYDVLVTVEDGPQKSVGGGLYFDSERGVGAQAFWEHRNLFGQAENLRVKAEIWRDSKEISQHFNKPGFLTRNTALVSDGWLREENTDAYEQRAAYVDGGLQHRFGKYVWGTFKASLEGGSLKDTEHPEQRYSMVGLPVQLRFDTTDSLLNATRGLRAVLTSGPYAGSYAEDFTVVPTRLDLQSFLSLWEKDTLVLALRASGGTLWRDDANTVPASIRYYSGGGGSVRGYEYQSLGKRDSHDNPRGGASFSEVSAEFRYKMTDTLGIVPFVDGGTVSESAIPSFSQDEILWSAGMGLRYYTSIGPLRLDVAMPLNPREGDSPGPAFYISIGQAF